MIDPFGTIMGNASTSGIASNGGFGGGAGRTYQSGMMTLDEPTLINNQKSSFIQNLKHH